MRKQFAWLWKNMDAPFRRRHVIALCVCAFTCLLLLVNPALSQRLIDDVIVAGNPEPLLSILAVMLVVKLGREGLRYMMVILLDPDRLHLKRSIQAYPILELVCWDGIRPHDRRTYL